MRLLQRLMLTGQLEPGLRCSVESADTVQEARIFSGCLGEVWNVMDDAGAIAIEFICWRCGCIRQCRACSWNFSPARNSRYADATDDIQEVAEYDASGSPTTYNYG